MSGVRIPDVSFLQTQRFTIERDEKMEQIRNILIFLDIILRCIIESDIALKGICIILLLLVILVAYRRRIKYPKRKNRKSKKKNNVNVTYIDSCWDEIQKENGYKK